MLIAHPEFARLVDYAMTHPSHPQLPEIREIQSGLVGAVMRKWDGSNRYEGTIRDEDGRDYLFRVRKFSQGDKYTLRLGRWNWPSYPHRTLVRLGIKVGTGW